MMEPKQSLVLPVILLCLSGCLWAQNWSSILAPARAIDWSQAGVVGGIPNRTNTCSTLSPGATAAQINTAITNCSSSGGGVVALNAGTYNNLSALNMKSNVTLRGAGADQTFLVFASSNGNNCSLTVDICFANGFVWYGSAAVLPGASNAATWSAGYAKGATSITLTGIGSSGLSVGQYIYLDQANGTSDTGNLYVCDNSCSAQGGSPGRVIGGVNHSQVQAVKITACNPSCTNGATFTISPALYAPNWSSAKTPGAWWSGTIQYAGIENLSMDHTAPGNSSGGAVFFASAFNCWMKGVRSISLGGYRNHVWLYQSGHNAIQDSYFYGAPGASLSYGIESRIASDDLVLNNIFHHVTTPLMDGSSLGEVYGYNFSINDYYAVNPSWLMPSASAHDAGTLYTLFEGNNGAAFRADIIHGGSGMNTLFRNRFNGWETGGKTNQIEAVIINSYNRYLNVIGNVLGQSGVQTAYQGGSEGGTSIFEIGSGDCCDGTVVQPDSLVGTTLMRWGNYDTFNAAIRFVAGENANGAPVYPGLANPSQTLPASFYLSSKPDWWGNTPWPPIGPDVTGGNIPNVGGHANAIPAQVCYSSVMGGPADGSGNPLSFNATACYGNGGPSPPQKLVAVPQ
jgi:hypothetical protein